MRKYITQGLIQVEYVPEMYEGGVWLRVDPAGCKLSSIIHVLDVFSIF